MLAQEIIKQKKQMAKGSLMEQFMKPGEKDIEENAVNEMMNAFNSDPTVLLQRYKEEKEGIKELIETNAKLLRDFHVALKKEFKDITLTDEFFEQLVINYGYVIF